MKRTQIQLDEETYQELRRRASDEGKSVSAVVRAILEEGLRATTKAMMSSPAPKRFRIEDFHFIGMGRSEPSRWDPISENHDDALAEDLYNEIIEQRDKLRDAQ